MERRFPQRAVPVLAAPTGARFSGASAIALIAVLAAGLSTAYGGRDRPIRELAFEVILAAAVAAAVVGVVPVALAVARRRLGILPLLGALLSAGAGAIHFAVIGAHFDEYWLYGLFFVAMGLFQLAWATTVVAHPESRLLLALGALANVAIVAAWIVTRTAGLLIGPSSDEVEPVGLADALASGFELVIVAVAVVLLSGIGSPLRFSRARGELVTWALSLVVVGATTLGLLSTVGAAPSVLPPSA